MPCGFADSYGRFHKIHHEWKAPIGLAAVYFHPIEQIQVCARAETHRAHSFSRPSTHTSAPPASSSFAPGIAEDGPVLLQTVFDATIGALLLGSHITVLYLWIILSVRAHALPAASLCAASLGAQRLWARSVRPASVP